MSCFQKFVQIYLVMLTFLLPLKFGTLSIMPETTGYFPAALWEYTIINFPGTSLAFFSGLGLILSLIAYGKNFFQTTNTTQIWLLRSWIMLMAISLLGIINASTLDYVFLSIGHVWGFSAYIISMILWLKSDESKLEILYKTITFSALAVMAIGVNQYFSGFDDQLEFYQSNQGAMDGQTVDLTSKINQRRVFSTLGGCNVFAGYLLLIAGVAFMRIKSWSEKVNPPRTSKMIFCGIFTVTLMFLFYHTGSRAVIMAVAGAAGFYLLFCSKIPLKYKISAIGLLIILSGAAIWSSVLAGRDFGSFSERLGYFRTSFLMLAKHPFAGSGWGDFFVDNLHYRNIALNEAARAPHNIWLNFAGHCGIFALLAILFCTLTPLFFGVKNYCLNRNQAQLPILLSLAAFTVHSLVEVNFQISANMALYGVLLYGAAMPHKDHKNKQSKIYILDISAMFILAVSTLGLGCYNTICEKRFDDFLTAVKPAKNLPDSFQIAETFQRVRQIKPYSPFPYAELAIYNVKIRNLNDALLYALKAIEKSPERPSYHSMAANIYYQLGDKSNALKYFRQAHQLHPANPDYQKSIRLLEL